MYDSTYNLIYTRDLTDSLQTFLKGVYTMEGNEGIIVGGKIYSYVSNTASSTSVTGTSSSDYIENSGSNVTISAVDSDDYILNSGRNVTIYGGNGNDTIFAGGNTSSVTSQYSRYSSTPSASHSTSSASVRSGYSGYTSTPSALSSTTTSSGGLSSSSVRSGYSVYYPTPSGSGASTTSTVGSSAVPTVKLENGKYVLTESGETVADVNDKSNYQELVVDGDKKMLFTTKSAYLVVDYTSIGYSYDTAGSVSGGYSGYSNVGVLDGGAGNDYIHNSISAPVTIVGGTGDDTIYGHSSSSTSSKTVYKYYSGDGNDTLYNYGSNDVLQVQGEMSASINGNDLIINVDVGSITLKDSANQNVKFVKIVQKDGNNYTYSGGNSVIDNYSQGEQINIAGDFTGIDVTEDGIQVKSSSGALDVENSRGKTVTYGDANGNVIASSYIAIGNESVNKENDATYQVLVGADNANNQLIAGSGGSSLWGGNGGADTLTGGAGGDEFIYSVGSGNDVIQNSNSNDVINLLGVSMEQITSIEIQESYVSATFRDGGSLLVEGNTGVGYKVNNTTYTVNQTTKEWVVKTA